MPLEAATYVILAIYQLLETILRGDLAIDRMHLEFNEMSSNAAIYTIIAIYQIFETTL